MLNLSSGYLAPLLCAGVATAAQPLVIGFLRRAAILDIPGARSSHSVSTPRGGGIAVVAGALAGITMVPSGVVLPLVIALLTFAAIGLVEDVRGIPVRLRLAMQIGAAVVVGIVMATEAGGSATAAFIAVAATVWITSFVNVFNFMDGINGISGAQVLLAGFVFCSLGIWLNDPSLTAASLTLAAAGLAFLPWNAFRSRVFLGDVGSYALGAGLAVLATYALVRGAPLEAVLAPLALYLADTTWTLQRRIRAREPWLEAHRTHVYQRLCDLGWSHQRVTAITVGVTSALSALGATSLLGLWHLRVLADILAVLLLAVYLRAPLLFAERRQQSERSLTHPVSGQIPHQAKAFEVRLSNKSPAFARKIADD